MAFVWREVHAGGEFLGVECRCCGEGTTSFDDAVIGGWVPNLRSRRIVFIHSAVDGFEKWLPWLGGVVGRGTAAALHAETQQRCDRVWPCSR
jgi:hypothetical protein